ncbi:carbon-nitrogen hydrolase family protein [Rhizobium sp. FKL33]|uniref:carbon-nitrogen hydrolase family protein n=1 Tax=Rhizobium sp. FKL33 TaxID=2562307 RepID=UPI001981CB36|nr:carbon-nitrogen hydrolase family protein [Rhizobium sp. FKL33]
MTSPSQQDNARFLMTGVQMPISLTENNIPAMRAKVTEVMALFPGTGMIVFSELAMHGPLEQRIAAEPEKDLEIFQDLAARHKVWIAPGSMYVRREGKVYNHAVIIDPDGAIVGRYDKLFPFRPFESGVTGGASVLAFDVPGVGRFGLSICYDIWFPEVMRALTSMGVEVLIHPTLTGTTDRAAENAIARATAAMFQCYVVDVNGLDGGGNGQSLVADPCGNAVYQAGQVTQIFPVMLDLGLVRQSRREGANALGQVLKSWRDRETEFDVYTPGRTSAYLDSLGPLVPMKR